MKLITEAAVDDKFNAQVGKIEDAISKLQDLIPELSKLRPVPSQRNAIDQVLADLKTLRERMFNG